MSRDNRDRRDERKERKEKKQIVIDVDKVFAGLCVGISAISLGVSLYSIMKINGFSKKLGMSIDELNRKTHVEITDDIVHRCTDRAVKDAANKAAKNVTDEIRRDMQDILSDKAAEAIKDQYDYSKDMVVKELSKKASNISISALRSEAKDEAVQILVDKLETQMDDIISAQTDKIENMAKAYKDMGEFIRNKA